MDLLAPPERFCFLDPAQVAAWARRLREARREQGRGEDEDRRPLQGLDLQCEGSYRERVAVGLYLPEPPSDDEWKDVLELSDSGCSPDPSAVSPPSGPSIYLCPERILDWARKVGVSHELVLDKVYYHELGHALMDTGPTPYGKLWCRIVEESLANWIAFSCFKGLEARWVQKLIQGQPAEYQGYAHL